MIRHLIPAVLVAACVGAEEPATPPAPAPAQPAAPATGATPAAAATTAPPETGPATVGTQPPAAPLHGVRGVRVARVASAAPWEAQVRLSGGYDSNALLESNPDKVSSRTAVYSADGSLSWRPIADERDYLKAGLNAGYDARPQLVDLDTTRLSASVAGARQNGSIAWGGSLVAGRYWVGSDGAAAELRGGASAAWLRQDSADLLTLEAAAIHYDAVNDRPGPLPTLSELGTADDRSGVLAAAGYRHWWLIADGGKVEAGTRAGRYTAQIDTETYTLFQPFMALRLRPGLWELQARATVDWRSYAGSIPEHDAERSLTVVGLLTADRRLQEIPLWPTGRAWSLPRGLSAGAYAAAASRNSSLPDRGYDRWQAGLRLTWNFTPEE